MKLVAASPSFPQDNQMQECVRNLSQAYGS